MSSYYSSYNNRNEMAQYVDPNTMPQHAPQDYSNFSLAGSLGGAEAGGVAPPSSATASSINRSEAEIAGWLAVNQITIYGDRVPQPMLLFSDLTAPTTFHQFFADMGFTAPTTIQSLAWPVILNKRDLVAIARTGSGKTMGFMVPAILHVLSQHIPHGFGGGPVVLVLAPTRELACQIEEESLKLIRRVPGIRACCVYGGVPKGPQCSQLRSCPRILVGTPGRLIDLSDMKVTNFSHVSYLVLDEADRMLDMGFEPQITKIVEHIPRVRQTLMFSATWPKEVRSLAARYQQDFIRVHVGSEELTANKDIVQHIVVANSEHDKLNSLIKVLMEIGWQRALIFTKTKRAADQLHLMLLNGLNGQGSPQSPTSPGSSYYPTRRPVLVIHGNKLQASRDEVLARFRQQDGAVLVATDVAARGLDIADLDVVINFELPSNIEDYVHRIGRTGRAGKKGDAYTIVCHTDPPRLLGDMANLVIQNGQEVSPELLALCEFRRGPGEGHYSSGRGGGYYGGRDRGWGGGGGGGYRGGYRGRARGRAGGMSSFHDRVGGGGGGGGRGGDGGYQSYPMAYTGATGWNNVGVGNGGGRGGFGGGYGGGGGGRGQTTPNPYISSAPSFSPMGGMNQQGYRGVEGGSSHGSRGESGVGDGRSAF